MLHASAAGHLEAGETLPECAVREAAEELGIVVDPRHLEFAHLCHSGEDGGRLQVFFACRTWQGEPRNAEPAKHGEPVWLPAHRLPGDVVPYCAQAIRAYLDGRPFGLHAWPGRDTPPPGTSADAGVLGDAGVPGALAAVLADVAAERRAQQRLWGVQHGLQDGTGAAAPVLAAVRAVFDRDPTTWAGLLAEETAEALAERDPRALRAELVQVAAVAVQWIQALDSRTGCHPAR
ncbi:hypothetical protein GCM10027294_40480 [Marinactinospora endophytica]